MKILTREFYSRAPEIVAKELIGKLLVRKLGSRRLEGEIVETEAYGGFEDPASHAYRGETKRNSVMFGEAGHAYVYFTYGFHHCLNFVTGTIGDPSAVLLRAVRPSRGIRQMLKKRNVKSINEISNGPGKLCQAFSIDRAQNNVDVTKRGAEIQVIGLGREPEILSSTRIGIKNGRERKWRFYVADNKFVSRPSANK